MRSSGALAKLATAVHVAAIPYTAVGVFGTVALMWAPYVFG
ncbi:hypothetical protein [Brevundimonas sp.]